MKRRKQRIDELLVDREMAEDLRESRALVMAGKVVHDGVVISKPGTSVPVDAPLHVRGGRREFASRGGYKLATGLDTFDLEVRGLDALDAGASTGGFTDCLLKRGVTKVYAVDVGYGQIRSSLANDARVAVMERTNIGDLEPATFPSPPRFCCADLSYLSLTKAIPLLEPLLASDAAMVCLVKPLYEGLAQPDVRSVDALGVVLGRLIPQLQKLANRNIVGLTPSPIYGGRGAIEFLLGLHPDRPPVSLECIDRALEDARALIAREG